MSDDTEDTEVEALINALENVVNSREDSPITLVKALAYITANFASSQSDPQAALRELHTNAVRALRTMLASDRGN